MMMPSVSIDVDSDEFLRSISLLAELLERLPELVNGLVSLGQLGPEFACLEDADLSTLRTDMSVLRIGLKPTDRLLKLVAALQACERELLIAKELAHC
jgi:hypothetical protein